MDLGVHLPQLNFGGQSPSLRQLAEYTKSATALGFAAVSVNDHLVFDVPWLDGLTALSAILGHAGNLAVATTVALPVLRGPVALAKALGTIDFLSGGRLIAGVAPGSSERDYAAAGVDFAERWQRFEESVLVLRALWNPGMAPVVGRWYSSEGLHLEPVPVQPGGPPIYVASWGSKAGLNRAARLGDGWMASAYNITPEGFAEAWSWVGEKVIAAGRDWDRFSNALATMWFYTTDRRSEAEAILRNRLLPAIHRPESILRARLPIGPASQFAEKLAAFQEAGVHRVFIWPVYDERRQLELFVDKVLPLLGAGSIESA